jgi:hypothetical protein
MGLREVFPRVSLRFGRERDGSKDENQRQRFSGGWHLVEESLAEASY